MSMIIDEAVAGMKMTTCEDAKGDRERKNCKEKEESERTCAKHLMMRPENVQLSCWSCILFSTSMCSAHMRMKQYAVAHM